MRLPDDLQAVDGEVIPKSRKVFFGMFAACVAMALFGVFLTIGRWSEGSVSITGIAFVVIGTCAAPFALYHTLFTKTVLVIGRDRIQIGKGLHRIHTEIPYSNIRSVEVVRGDGPQRVAIVLLDMSDPDTVCPGGALAFNRNRQRFACDLPLQWFAKAPKVIHKMIREYWQPPDKNDPRLRRLG